MCFSSWSSLRRVVLVRGSDPVTLAFYLGSRTGVVVPVLVSLEIHVSNVDERNLMRMVVRSPYLRLVHLRVEPKLREHYLNQITSSNWLKNLRGLSEFPHPS